MTWSSGTSLSTPNARTKARTLCRSHGFALTDVRTVLVLAEMSRREGNSAEAAKRFDEALSGFRTLEVPEGIAQCRLAQGKMLLATESPAAAAEALEEAAATARRAELPSIEVPALAHRARQGKGGNQATEAFTRLHDRVAAPEQLEAYLCLAESTGEPSYAEKGAELEAMLLAGAPDAYRSSLRDALRKASGFHNVEKSRGTRP